MSQAQFEHEGRAQGNTRAVVGGRSHGQHFKYIFSHLLGDELPCKSQEMSGLGCSISRREVTSAWFIAVSAVPGAVLGESRCSIHFY